MKTLKLWLRFAAVDLQQDLAYRANFIVKRVAELVFNFLGPITALVIYNTSEGLPGWSLYQLLFFQGTLSLVLGLASMIFGRFGESVIDDIQHGRMDLKLVRPVKPLLYVFSRSPRLDTFGGILVGIAIIWFSLTGLEFSFNIINAMFYGLFVFLALLFLLSLEIFISALGFLVVKSWALLDLFYSITRMAEYPITIYGRIGVLFFTFVFPIGLAAFYPASAFLGIAQQQSVILVVASALTFFTISVLLWSAGIKKYTSAGG